MAKDANKIDRPKVPKADRITNLKKVFTYMSEQAALVAGKFVVTYSRDMDGIGQTWKWKAKYSSADFNVESQDADFSIAIDNVYDMVYDYYDHK